ncbi:MAG: MFS transporter, partial [Candidatus Bathyarchaeota archaeon]
AIVLRAVTQTINFPAIHALRADIVPIEKRGRVIGLISVLKNLARAFSALFFGWMYQSISPSSVFLSAAVLEFCSLGVIFLSFKQLKQRI